MTVCSLFGTGSMNQPDYQQQQQNTGSPIRGMYAQQQAPAQQGQRGPRRRMRRPYQARF